MTLFTLILFTDSNNPDHVNAITTIENTKVYLLTSHVELTKPSSDVIFNCITTYYRGTYVKPMASQNLASFMVERFLVQRTGINSH